MSDRLVAFATAASPEDCFYQHLNEVIARQRPRAPHADIMDAARPLMLGYVGANNIGADVRTSEMLRQFDAVFEDFAPVVMAVSRRLDPELFGGRRVNLMNGYFPEQVESMVSACNAVIACEGSMFTSTFSDSLSLVFASGLAVAHQQGIPAVGYGADVGRMTERLTSFVQTHCAGAALLCRSQRAVERLQSLGLPAQGGADSAWTFDCTIEEQAHWTRGMGLDFERGVAVVCPINPFWWPVAANVERASRLLLHPEDKALHYRSVYFHNWSDEVAAKYERYIREMASCIDGLRAKGHQVVMLCMEPVDVRAAEHINGKLVDVAPTLVSGRVSAKQAFCVISKARLVVSSRFHATLFAHLAERPVVGVSMDDRIFDLFESMGVRDSALDCRADHLSDLVLSQVDDLLSRPEWLSSLQRKAIARHVRQLGVMGMTLADLVPRWTRRPRARHAGWDGFLPPLSARLNRILSAA